MPNKNMLFFWQPFFFSSSPSSSLFTIPLSPLPRFIPDHTTFDFCTSCLLFECVSCFCSGLSLFQRRSLFRPNSTLGFCNYSFRSFLLTFGCLGNCFSVILAAYLY
ncbi:MAG: hypothetical protein J3R72DRAFT_461448 [Linnemannia gamsii]|nr:MAG: hypothetical protein J3R72DRAFT_461448 [Linnemannia gamsii]